MSVFVRGKPMRRDSAHVVRGRRTRDTILASARMRILAEGFEALRLDDLATDAGVTKAAVIKSVGGKPSILLTLGDEDRQTRLEVIRAAFPLRTGLRRRLEGVVRQLYELDLARMNVVMAYVGYMWFWSGADHDRAQAMLDETHACLEDLITAASPTQPGAARLNMIAKRILGGYVIGLRDLRYRGATLEEATRFVVDYVLE